MAQTVNLSSTAYQVIASRHATLAELSTIYGLEDALNLIELSQVENYNKQIMSELNNANTN